MHCLNFLEQPAEEVADLEMISPQALEEIEADTFWCFSKLLDGIQVPPPPPADL